MRGRIGADEFIEIYKDLSTRPEVYFLMVRYANKDYLTCDDLQLFLETEQGVVCFCQFTEKKLHAILLTHKRKRGITMKPKPKRVTRHASTVILFSQHLFIVM